MNLQLKSCCCGCGETTGLYGSNCKHMTLCSTCAKTMAKSRSKCSTCGTTLTRLIREYNVHASSVKDKDYFIGKFMTGLPDFSKKKSAKNKWSLKKDGLKGRQVTDSTREKYKNRPWLLEDETGQSQFQGHLEGSQSATYYLLMKGKKEFIAIPVGSWYNFKKNAQYKQLTLEEAEEKMNNRKKKTADGYQRWMMKAANNGAFGEHGKLDDKESKRSRQKTGDDDEGPSSDNGEEDEDEEVDRKSRHGLNKKSGYDDDDDEGPRGGDLDDDDYDVEKGDDWEHEEVFTDDDETLGNDPEEREDLDPEVPAPPEIKQDDDDEEDEDNEEGGGLSKPGKELKKLLGRTGGPSESDEEDDDDDDVDDEDGVPAVTATKQKEPKEEPIDNSPSKPTATGPARGTPTSKGKRKENEEAKPSVSVPPKKAKTENAPKSSGKDVNGSTSKSNAPPRGTLPRSSNAGSSYAASGPVTEEEIRAVLMQSTPLTIKELAAKFKARLKSEEDKKAFGNILRTISKKKITNGSIYVILREK